MCWRVPVCTHVFAVWLYKPGESRELSEGGCPGFLRKKDEGCAGDATCSTVVETKKKRKPHQKKLTNQWNPPLKPKKIDKTWSISTNKCHSVFLLMYVHNKSPWSKPTYVRITTFQCPLLSFMEAVCLLSSCLNSHSQLMDFASPACSLLGLR